MICSHCGAELPQRSRPRMIITGMILIAAAMALVFLSHLPVFVLAAVLMAVAGASLVRGTKRGHPIRCVRCGGQSRL